MSDSPSEWRDGDELAEEARLHYEGGRYLEAEASLRQALARNPDRPEWHFHLARLLELTHRHKEARESYYRCHELDPDAPEPLLAAAALDGRDGDLSSALKLVETAVSLDRESDESHAHRIRLLNNMKRFDDARDAFYEAQEFVESPTLSMISMADGLEQQGEPARAAWCYREALRHDDAMPEVRVAYARCLANQGEHAKALQQFMHVLRENPGGIDALLGCAEVLALLGRESDAAEKLRRVVEIEPANIQAHHCLGALELRAARYDRAAIEFELVLKLAPDHNLVRLDLADAQFRRGHTSEARQTMRALLAEGLPESPASEGLQLTALELQRRTQHWGAVMARASALLAALRLWDAAAKVIPRFVELHAEEPNAWRALARACYESGDIANGESASAKVLALDPRCALSHHNLALAALRRADLPAAHDWVRRGLAVARTDEGLRRLRSRIVLARIRRSLRWLAWPAQLFGRA